MMTPIPMALFHLPCADCNKPMMLITDWIGGVPFASRYQCSCGATHGAHASGAPMGTPGDRVTRALRQSAHASFDRLWSGGKAFMDRNMAYRWMGQTLRLSKDQAHIGLMDAAQCKALMAAVDEFLYAQPFSAPQCPARAQKCVYVKCRCLYCRAAMPLERGLACP